MVRLLLLAVLLQAPPKPVTPLVRILDVAEVQALLPRASVVDARPLEDFKKGHIPGAQSMPWEAFTLEAPGVVNWLVGDPARWGKVPTPDMVQPRLRAMGLSNARTVVVVGDPKGWGDEGRAAWSLLYWGAADVVLLDGGLPAWQAAGRPLQTGAPVPAKAGDFQVNVVPARRALLEDVRVVSQTRGMLLDVRTPEEFAGEAVPGQKRGGHIPYARLVPHVALYNANGSYVDAATLTRLVEGDSALGTGTTSRTRAPVTYCTGGVRSALLAVLLEARLGVVAANYDGSMWEWAARKDTPVTRDP